MKKFFVIAAAALALVACNKEQKFAEEPKADAIAVGFDIYAARGIDTKTGFSGPIKDTDVLKGTEGFGVFAYYTNGSEYDSNSLPNFMYNQQVKWDGSSAWTYAPVKYWPNEYGANAVADERDKVSFFAYAPYVEVTPSNGKITAPVEETTWGITGLTRNTANGDPMVKYMVSFERDKQVDLLWGVAPSEAEAPGWETSNENSPQVFLKGSPWLNVERPKTAADQKLKFVFMHALSGLAVNIDADPDIATHDGTTAIAAGTKVYVRSVTFSGFALKGALNLNNTIQALPYWKDYAGVDDLMTGEDVTIFDGRKDGKEGYLDAAAPNEKVLGLQADIISNDGNTTSGVTAVPTHLFDADEIFVIPTGDKVNVTIVYDVETEDANLAGYLSDGSTPGSRVQNVITKKAVLPALLAGMRHTINIHLGLTSVKFDVEVEEWQGPSDTDAWLPENF